MLDFGWELVWPEDAIAGVASASVAAPESTSCWTHWLMFGCLSSCQNIDNQSSSTLINIHQLLISHYKIEGRFWEHWQADPDFCICKLCNESQSFSSKSSPSSASFCLTSRMPQANRSVLCFFSWIVIGYNQGQESRLNKLKSSMAI